METTASEHLVQGYTFSQVRLAERGITEAEQALNLLATSDMYQ